MLFSLDITLDRTSALNPIDIELVKATRVIMTTQLEPRVLVHKAYKKDN
mgnify:CR=1 FL=1